MMLTSLRHTFNGTPDGLFSDTCWRWGWSCLIHSTFPRSRRCRNYNVVSWYTRGMCRRYITFQTYCGSSVIWSSCSWHSTVCNRFCQTRPRLCFHVQALSSWTCRRWCHVNQVCSFYVQHICRSASDDIVIFVISRMQKSYASVSGTGDSVISKADPQGDTFPLHFGWVDPCNYPKCKITPSPPTDNVWAMMFVWR